jgi:urease accessory protein
VEQACELDLIVDVVGLADYLYGRLCTSGTVSAHAAAAVCWWASRASIPVWLWRTADAELDARIVSPAARSVSRQQGGQLLRSALEILPVPVLGSLAHDAAGAGADPHHPVVFGAVAASAGLSPEQAAAAAGYGAVACQASAAVRLLGLDPARVARTVAELTAAVDLIAGEAARWATRPLAQLPSYGAPVSDLLAEQHFARKERLFAS